jgi:hypothetical protein
MLPSTLKYIPLNQSECIFPRNSRTVQMILCAMLLRSTAHSIICTRLFRGKMHSDWFNGIDILQGRWQHGERVGYCYPSGLDKTLCQWEVYVPLVTKGLKHFKKCLFLQGPTGRQETTGFGSVPLARSPFRNTAPIFLLRDHLYMPSCAYLQTAKSSIHKSTIP